MLPNVFFGATEPPPHTHTHTTPNIIITGIRKRARSRRRLTCDCGGQGGCCLALCLVVLRPMSMDTSWCAGSNVRGGRPLAAAPFPNTDEHVAG